MDRAAFTVACQVMGLMLSEAQVGAFEEFETALYERNKVMNLTRVSQGECWQRHFADSLLLAEFLPLGATVLDLGSGPGLPSWPLAVARTDLRVTALDSSGKMIGFLSSQPLPNLALVQERAETWKPISPFDVVTGRALAPLTIQLEVSAPLCAVGGLVLPMRTPKDRPVPHRVQPLGLVLEAIHERMVVGDDATRVFPAYRKIAATSSKYPRAWAEIRHSPLRGEGYE